MTAAFAAVQSWKVKHTDEAFFHLASVFVLARIARSNLAAEDITPQSTSIDSANRCADMISPPG